MNGSLQAFINVCKFVKAGREGAHLPVNDTAIREPDDIVEEIGADAGTRVHRKGVEITVSD